MHFLSFFLFFSSPKCQITIFEMTFPQILQLSVCLRGSVTAGKSPCYVCNTSWKVQHHKVKWRQPLQPLHHAHSLSLLLFKQECGELKGFALKSPNDRDLIHHYIISFIKNIKTDSFVDQKDILPQQKGSRKCPRDLPTNPFFCVFSSVLWSRAWHQGYKISVSSSARN